MATILEQQMALSRECESILEELADNPSEMISPEAMATLRAGGRITGEEWQESQRQLQALVDRKRNLRNFQGKALVFNGAYEELQKELDKSEDEVPKLLAELEPKIEELTKKKNVAIRNRERLRNRKSEADAARAELRKDKYQLPSTIEAYRLSWAAVNNTLGEKLRTAESELHVANVALENDEIVKSIGQKNSSEVGRDKQKELGFNVAKNAGCTLRVSNGAGLTAAIVDQDAWKNYVSEQKKVAEELTPMVEDLQRQFEQEREACERIKDCWLSERHPLDG